MWDQNEYIKAWNFASKAHQEQFLPGSEIPYINHIGLVTMEVMSAIAYQEKLENKPIMQPNLAVVCALLHDTIEDTSVTFDDIVSTFDEQTACGVLALSKDTTLPSKQAQMLDSLQRINKQPAEISVVKLADRITNLQPPPHYWTKEKIANYRKEAQTILDSLGDANEYLAKRLAEKIKQYQQYC